MTEASAATRCVIIERELGFPPDRVWRALTKPHLIAEWLMLNDFEPEIGHRFDFRADWGSVACEVLAVEPMKTLAYSWVAYGLESTITWTLTPTKVGTRLRMEQAGFRTDQDQAYQGAQAGWQRFLAQLEAVMARSE